MWLLRDGNWRETTLEEWKEEKMAEEFDADAMTEYYLRLRRMKAAMNKDNDTRIAPVSAEMARVEGVMLEFLDSHKMKSAPSAHGTIYKELDIKPRATDWTAFYNWIKEHDAFEFLHKRISAEAVSSYMELHKDDDVSLPPGVDVMKEYVVRVRTGKEK